MSGILYLVATPIGNLEDITYRAVRVLAECAVIACEDTRQTRKLLDHYAITRPLVSYHEHNEAERSAELMVRLRGGDSVALVSDAGTPLVADPGYRLVTAAAREGVRVVPIPGPSAALAALSGSGLATDEFRFCGFLPPKSGQRERRLEELRDDPATLVFYEAPHRILETLDDLARLMPRRPVVVARELTKIHEEFVRGTAAEVRASLEARHAVRGEMVVLVGKAEAQADDSTPIEEAVEAAMLDGLSRMDAMKAVAKQRGLSKREVYDLMEAAKKA